MEETRRYEGEVHDIVAGFPCTYKYTSPAPVHRASQLPLAVLIPGGASHARIYYGGHGGHDPENFLGTWLSRAGFPVLAISYPLESENGGIATGNAAGFRLKDWGRQAAYVTRKLIDEQAIANQHVVLASWSMGGRMVIPFTEVAERECGLRVDLAISLCATQGFSSNRPIPPGIRCTSNGFADCDGLLDKFLLQLREQDRRQRKDSPIIPPDTYASDYFGYTPISLHGWQLQHEQCSGTGSHRFISDPYGAEEEAAPLGNDFSRMPWFATITCTASIDARHVLLDELMWKSWTAQRMTAIWEQQQAKALTDCQRTLPPWNRFSHFVRQISQPGVLHRKVEGNHFFFVGREGASSTASAIMKLWEERNMLHLQLGQILGKEPAYDSKL